MANLWKKWIPNWILDYRMMRSYQARKTSHRGKSIETIFSSIHEQNGWGSDESVSGQGSNLALSQNVIKGLEKIIVHYKITTLLDIPCGDYHWMQHVDRTNCTYFGADIVEAIVTGNEHYENENTHFLNLDITKDPLPKSDLILVRDCFVHFSFRDIETSLRQIYESGATYVLMTTFEKFTRNFDITTGDWRPINFRRAPFHFPSPVLLITENTTPGYEKEYRQKSLGLWRIDDLRQKKSRPLIK